ncbi:flagellar hook-length control protein FliK [Sphingomonas sp. NBWT7]|uniref:flagellar hook-length control protein FliK n=1 Tax=Sphingomonas sp. NBWT7 TaxID=2596913 RepID=UPI001CA50EA2|nr:flagellar hook-length control protein FliK [Sphingomonas sp. NBWT7]
MPGSSTQSPAAGFANLFPAIVAPVMPRQRDAEPGKALPATGAGDASATPWIAPSEWPAICPPTKPLTGGAAKGIGPQTIDPSANRAPRADAALDGVGSEGGTADAGASDAETAPGGTPLGEAVDAATATLVLGSIAPGVCPPAPVLHVELVVPIGDQRANGGSTPSVCPAAPDWQVETVGSNTGVPPVGVPPVMPLAPAAIGTAPANADGASSGRIAAPLLASSLSASPVTLSLIKTDAAPAPPTFPAMAPAAENGAGPFGPTPADTRATPIRQPAPFAPTQPANGEEAAISVSIAAGEPSLRRASSIATDRASLPQESTRTGAATVALQPADQLTVPQRVAPAAQMFAAAIQRAVRADRRPAEPALANPLLGDAAPLAMPAVAAAETSRHAALDMARANWPGAMIERIERLRDAADAADTSIRLVPDRLGAIDVSLRRDGDTVAVQFSAQAAETRQLLADAQPRLSEMAEAKGLRLSLHAGDGGSANGQPQSQSQPQPQQRAAATFINRARASSPDADVTAADRVA